MKSNHTPWILTQLNLSKQHRLCYMIHNNLDNRIAQFPHELITYGGNGAVFQNWAQYRLVMKYLCEMEDDQTLVMYSGHPLGFFRPLKISPSSNHK